MNCYTIAGIEVMCLQSIDDAEQWACKQEIHPSISLVPPIIRYARVDISPRTRENWFLNAAMPPAKQYEVSVNNYTNDLSSKKNFYNCFLDEKVKKFDIERDVFEDAHDFIRGSFFNSNDRNLIDVTNSRYYKIASIISEMRDDIARYAGILIKEMRLFSVKNEIIVFTGRPIIRATVEIQDYNQKNSISKAWAYFLERPSYCARFQVVSTTPKEP